MIYNKEMREILSKMSKWYRMPETSTWQDGPLSDSAAGGGHSAQVFSRENSMMTTC